VTFNLNARKELLCMRLCKDVVIEQRPDNELMLQTHFTFRDGDRYPF